MTVILEQNADYKSNTLHYSRQRVQHVQLDVYNVFCLYLLAYRFSTLYSHVYHIYDKSFKFKIIT